MTNYMDPTTDVLSDLVRYQREEIRQLKNKLDRVKLNADTLDSEFLYNEANALGEAIVLVPKKLIEELKESVR